MFTLCARSERASGVFMFSIISFSFGASNLEMSTCAARTRLNISIRLVWMNLCSSISVDMSSFCWRNGNTISSANKLCHYSLGGICETPTFGIVVSDQAVRPGFEVPQEIEKVVSRRIIQEGQNPLKSQLKRGVDWRGSIQHDYVYASWLKYHAYHESY